MHRFCEQQLGGQTRLLILGALWLWMSGYPGTLLAKPSQGKDIYQHLCVKCHGTEGQGVKGKYDDVLRGDWSIEKLTRVIDKTMPEDAPEKCRGADAEAVARYIYDAFYSREAQERKHPPRVELVHLTQRQYGISLADLFRGFEDSDPPLPKERGLQATYYDSGGFGSDHPHRDRLDSVVDFDFRTQHPNSALSPTNEFSIRWQGSVLAPETGEYEFLVRTELGCRLWVNDKDQPLVDASVASGQDVEHRGTRKLIGGRWYPLKLECFKHRETNAMVSLQWKPPRGTREILPNRQLVPAAMVPLFVTSTPFPPDDSSVGYERGVAVSKAWQEATVRGAIEAANYAVQHLQTLAHVPPGDSNRLAAVQSFSEALVEAAFRRPLSAGDRHRYVETPLRSTPKLDDGVKRVVIKALMAPQFLYPEIGTEGHPGYATASRLALALWDSIPDRALRTKAAHWNPASREDCASEARRLLGDLRGHAKLMDFFHHWLQVDRIEDVSKDPEAFPGFTPAIVQDLRVSLDLFLEDVAWGDHPDYRRLLLEETLFLNARLARYYGISGISGDDFVRVRPPEGQRSGVLTHPYLLSFFAYPKSSSPIHRGVFLTRNIVGRALRPPPMAVAFKDADFPAGLSMRQKVSELTKPQACQTCHSVINPLGFSLEHFDAVGRYRTREQDRPVDSVVEYLTDEGQSLRLSGAEDIARFAIGNRQAQEGFLEQLFHQVVKQPMRAYGAEMMERLRGSFEKNHFDLQQLLVDIACISALDDPVSGHRPTHSL